MTSKRKTYHHGDLRAALIAKATTQIQAEGLESISVRRLARDAGVAHRAAYQHFADKDALIAAVLANAYASLDQRLRKSARKDASPQDALHTVARTYAAFAFEEPRIFLAMTGPRVNASGAYPELEAALRGAWRHVTEPVRQGVESKVFIADARLAATVFWSGLQGVLTQILLDRIKVAKPARRRFITDIAARLIAAISR